MLEKVGFLQPEFWQKSTVLKKYYKILFDNQLGFPGLCPGFPIGNGHALLSHGSLHRVPCQRWPFLAMGNPQGDGGTSDVGTCWCEDGYPPTPMMSEHSGRIHEQVLFLGGCWL